MRISSEPEEINGEKNGDERLAVIAPRELWGSLRKGLIPLYPNLKLIPRPPAGSARLDPYGVGFAARSLKPRPDAIILLASKRRSPLCLVPAPVVYGIPVGLLPVETPAQLEPWLSALSATYILDRVTWAVLAMWKDFYLTWGQRFAQWMKAGVKGNGIKVRKWFADTLSRDELCRKLAGGPQFVLYLGHGRPRGWSGYRGLRWKHVAAEPLERPIGTIMSLSCATLKRERNRIPFGAEWISQGRACSYFGSVTNISVYANATLAKQMGELFANGNCRTIGQLLNKLETRLKQGGAELTKAYRALSTYRLMGNPLQPLH